MPHRASLLLFVLATGCEPTTPLPGPTPPAPSPARAPDATPTPPETPTTDAPPRFGIGGGERARETHVAFETPRDLIAASARVVIDRGGGTADYDEMDDVADLAQIQNPPAGQHVGPYPWQTGVAYEYRVERGAQVTLPPGDYQLIPDRPVVHVARPRTMWAWRFTVRPVTGDGPTYAAVLYSGAATFTSFYLWNESGYGSTDDAQHTSWSTPRYRQAGAAEDVAATSWQRF